MRLRFLAHHNPLMPRFTASVPPLVSTTSTVSAPTDAATRSRPCPRPPRAAAPCAWAHAGVPSSGSTQRDGAATSAPTWPALAGRVQATSPAGHAWRSLRCDTYVLGSPRGSGPADDASIVLRGKALRDTFVLRFIALERLIRGTLLIALAYGVWRFDGSRPALRRVVNSYLPAI